MLKVYAGSYRSSRRERVHAFFPDLTHDVTDQISLDRDSLQFTYTTPPLGPDGFNTFILQIGRVSPHTRQLQRNEAKLEKRIVALNRLLKKAKSKEVKPDDLEQIQKMRTLLANVASRIQKRINDQFEILSEARLPLQVDNNVAGPHRYIGA